MKFKLSIHHSLKNQSLIFETIINYLIDFVIFLYNKNCVIVLDDY